LKDAEFLSYTIAKIEDKIAKLKKGVRNERNEYKRNRLKSALWKTRKELDLLLIPFMGSGESESATQQTVTRKMERVQGLTHVRQKSWQVLSVALASTCLESFRDFSPLKRVPLARDWVGVAKRNGLVPLPR